MKIGAVRISKNNDTIKQDKVAPKKEWPALLKATLFVLAVLVATVIVLKLYQWQVDNFNVWTGLGLPPYESEQIKTISIAVFAICSLMAVLWRSIISAAQVKELQAQGRRTETQIENTEKQIEQTEVKNLTELFTKGVELINTPEPEKNSALVLAGVSILHQVALRQDVLFRKQVEDILAKSFLENTTLTEDSPAYMWTVLETLDNIANYNNNFIVLYGVAIEKYNCNKYYNNIIGISYYNCEFYNKRINNTDNKFYECKFSGVFIKGIINIINGAKFFNCTIEGIVCRKYASFDKINISKSYLHNRVIFSHINFSGCYEWNMPDNIKVAVENCFYSLKNPPVEPLKTLIDEANKKAAEIEEEANDVSDRAESAISDATTTTTTPKIDDK